MYKINVVANHQMQENFEYWKNKKQKQNKPNKQTNKQTNKTIQNKTKQKKKDMQQE